MVSEMSRVLAATLRLGLAAAVALPLAAACQPVQRPADGPGIKQAQQHEQEGDARRGGQAQIALPTQAREQGVPGDIHLQYVRTRQPPRPPIGLFGAEDLARVLGHLIEGEPASHFVPEHA